MLQSFYLPWHPVEEICLSATVMVCITIMAGFFDEHYCNGKHYCNGAECITVMVQIACLPNLPMVITCDH
jgi:hypothetical protein